jgi:hypothetical protein
MKYLIIILNLAVLSGCNVKRWCYNRYPPVETIVTETKYDTIWRDTTIFVHIPADTVYAEKVVFKTPEGYQTDLSVLHTTYAKSTAQVLKGVLLHELFQKETEIEKTIKDAIKEHSTHTVDTIEKVYEVPYVTPWHNFTVRFFWIAMIFISVYLLLRFMRR